MRTLNLVQLRVAPGEGRVQTSVAKFFAHALEQILCTGGLHVLSGLSCLPAIGTARHHPTRQVRLTPEHPPQGFNIRSHTNALHLHLLLPRIRIQLQVPGSSIAHDLDCISASYGILERAFLCIFISPRCLKCDILASSITCRMVRCKFFPVIIKDTDRATP